MFARATGMVTSTMTDELVPKDTPEEVVERVAVGPRTPVFDPTLGHDAPKGGRGTPRHRLVTIGDSLTQGFQSGAIYNTDLSYPAIIARELGWFDSYRYPRYGGAGGLPLNLEYILRDLEHRYGFHISPWELPLALFRARQVMDEIEDYWERGPGATAPVIAGYNHCLAVYGWDIRDALSRTAKSCETAIATPNDSLLDQIVENNGARAALRVYPRWDERTRSMTLLQAAQALGEDRGEDDDHGIETLVVFLGANNALRSVTDLEVKWSGDDYKDVRKKGKYTVWRPSHFISELAELEQAVERIAARHVIWCTVPHVTIPPVSRGVGRKVAPGSRYFPYYTRPWITDQGFDPLSDPHITDRQARAVDYAVDLYNDAITAVVERARTGSPARDWYLLDIAGLLDRLASRRYILDPNARPPWWSPYPLPAPVKALAPVVDSQFLRSDGRGGRETGGLFSIDGVHPTTVGYGLSAQEMINIMRMAGVEFRHGNGALRSDPVTVDFNRLIQHDSLVRTPPQNLDAALNMLDWADQALDWVKIALPQSG